MTFQPAIPLSGLAGWSLLQKTLPEQKAAFENFPTREREIKYFRENISKVMTPQDLIDDRILLKVSLGAFGLQDDLPNKFFVKKVLEDGVSDPAALANRMSDGRYANMSRAFGFGLEVEPRTQRLRFADQIIEKYSDQSFEAAVGEVDGNLRLALSLERELDDVLASKTGEDARWFSVMGTPPLRAIFESAFGLPSAFGSLDLDKQLETFKEKSEKLFGVSEVADFQDPEIANELRSRFLLLAEPVAAAPVAPIMQLFGGGTSGGVLAALYS